MKSQNLPEDGIQMEDSAVRREMCRCLPYDDFNSDVTNPKVLSLVVPVPKYESRCQFQSRKVHEEKRNKNECF